MKCAYDRNRYTSEREEIISQESLHILLLHHAGSKFQTWLYIMIDVIRVWMVPGFRNGFGRKTKYSWDSTAKKQKSTVDFLWLVPSLQNGNLPLEPSRNKSVTSWELCCALEVTLYGFIFQALNLLTTDQSILLVLLNKIIFLPSAWWLPVQ